MRLLGNSNHKRTTNHRIVREHEFGPDAPYALPSLASSPSRNRQYLPGNPEGAVTGLAFYFTGEALALRIKTHGGQLHCSI